MYEILLNLHKANRYLLLLTLLVLIINSAIKFFTQKPFTPTDNKISLITLISTHGQLVLGLLLYTVSPLVNFNPDALRENPVIRYYTAEHISSMLLAIVLITLGRILAKRRFKQIGSGKPVHLPHKSLLIFSLIGLIIILHSLQKNGIIL